MVTATPTPKTELAAASEERRARIAERRAAFESEQKARQEAFERDMAAEEARFNRAAEEEEAAHALAEKIATARAECDEMALAEGRITPEEIVKRDTMIRQQGFGALLSWQVLPDEPRTRMAFDRNVMVILPEANHAKVFFSKGYDDVPESLVSHSALAGSVTPPKAKVKAGK